MRLYIKIILLLFTVLSSDQLLARQQGKALIDSMLKELPGQKEDTNKANLLYALSSEYAGIDPAEGIKYGRLMLDLATKLNWGKGIVMANSAIAECYQGRSDHARSLEYDQAALRQAERSGNKALIASSAMSIGFDYKALGDGPKEIEYFLKALKIGEEIGDKACIANSSVQIAGVYWVFRDYSKALEYNFKAMKIFEAAGRGLGGIEHNIALDYLGELDYQRALEYLLRSVGSYERSGDTAGSIGPIGSIGDLYKQQKNYVMAVTYALKALKMSEMSGDTVNRSCALINIGEAYIAIVKDGAAENKQMYSNSEFGGAGYRVERSIPTGRAALLKGAIDHIQQGIEAAKKIHALYILKEAYQTLAEAYKLNGAYRESLEATDNFHAIKDSLFSQEKGEQIMMLGVKYEYSQQRLADSMRAAGKEQIAMIKLEKQKTFTWVGIAGIILLTGFSFFIVKERGKSEKERMRSDELLLNILPAEVAGELKANGSSKARNFDNVTVLFTDFVNFTEAGERMRPNELIEELNTCFKKFDEITVKHNIEKIKTIGDAYLAVAGLPVADAKHAEHVVHAAKEISAFMEDRIARIGNRTFEIRIGIHSGSVVAGIVGIRKFAYDIWGDAVNTAARLEQHSEPGKINISDTTYMLVKDKFTCEYRGEIEAKGKGKMKMYYVS